MLMDESSLIAFTTPPFTCENEGWGEFEMQIELYYTDKSGKITIPHDLNFQQNRYEDEHQVTFKNPSQNLQQILRETGPLPSDEDRRNRKVEGGVKKQKKPFDVEKMAAALVKLEEDDLLQVIQMIHDHKSEDTYVQNNLDGMFLRVTPPLIPFSTMRDVWNCMLTSCSVAAGEFSVDLYTLPDALGKMIWDYLVSHPVAIFESGKGLILTTRCRSRAISSTPSTPRDLSRELSCELSTSSKMHSTAFPDQNFDRAPIRPGGFGDSTATTLGA